MQEELIAIRKWLGQGSINIFGMPFAGKDTQGGVLADLLGAELMGGGQILRNSVIPKHVRKIMDAGDLIPTPDYLRIVLPYLSQQKFHGKPLVLSSVGRWHGEEEGVLQAAEASMHPLKAVILLTVSEDTARQRNTKAASEDRGERADDAKDAFETRVEEFHQKTLPVIEFYGSKGLLVEVDGNPKPPEVTSQIITKLFALAQAQ